MLNSIVLIIIIVVLLLLFISVIGGADNTPNTSKSKAKKDYSKFRKKDILSPTELKFYRELKPVADRLRLTVCPQVGLEEIIHVVDGNYSDRGKIKSKRIDFTLVRNSDFKTVCCIELDDYTHKYKKRQNRDNFVNELFDNVGIKLFRIKVQDKYDMIILENKLREIM